MDTQGGNQRNPLGMVPFTLGTECLELLRSTSSQLLGQSAMVTRSPAMSTRVEPWPSSAHRANAPQTGQQAVSARCQRRHQCGRTGLNDSKSVKLDDGDAPFREAQRLARPSSSAGLEAVASMWGTVPCAAFHGAAWGAEAASVIARSPISGFQGPVHSCWVWPSCVGHHLLHTAGTG